MKAKRKASSFNSLPGQRPEKKSKSMYTVFHKTHIEDLLSDRRPKSRGDIRRRNGKCTCLEVVPDSVVASRSPTTILLILLMKTEQTIIGIVEVDKSFNSRVW